MSKHDKIDIADFRVKGGHKEDLADWPTQVKPFYDSKDAYKDMLEAGTERLLRKLGVEVHTDARVAEVLADGVRLADGRILPAELVVWAAGVKGAEFLTRLDGLETNRINQLVVRQTLQTTADDHIFAMGDCAACPWPEKNGFVPPRAQAAHQQASHLYKQLQRRIAGKPMEDYRYRDFGSLVSLGAYSTVGSLMGNLIGGSMMIEGRIARLAYISLYRMHQVALHGWVKMLVISAVARINRIVRPRLKLH